MYKLIVLCALVAACTAAPRPGLVAYSPLVSPVVSPVVSHVPVAYSSQSSSVVHTAPVYSAPVGLVRTVPVASPVAVHTVPLTYSPGLQTVFI